MAWISAAAGGSKADEADPAPWPIPVACAQETELAPRPAGQAEHPRYDHHVHLLSPTLIADWKSLGMPFSRADEEYSDAQRVLQNVRAERAIAVSMAHLYSSDGFAELEKVQTSEAECVASENDFIAGCCAQHPDRLVGFFSLNPLREYAQAEFERCRIQPGLVGLKLHLPACGIDLTNQLHFQQLQQTFAACADHRLPILIHVFYGEEDPLAVARFWELVEAHPDLQLILAHVGSSGGFNQLSLALLDGYVALRQSNPRWQSSPIYFDLSGAVLTEETDGAPPTSEAWCEKLSQAMPRVGWDRFLPASDYPVFAPDQLAGVLRDKLKLPEERVRQILENRAPVLKTR
jgi:predicted TIM-barrel fold metal-dependent hydrolase